MRLWIAFNMYGQYPARYGKLVERGFEYYFGNQSAAWAACAGAHGTHDCALRFEAHGPEQARGSMHPSIHPCIHPSILWVSVNK